MADQQTIEARRRTIAAHYRLNPRCRYNRRRTYWRSRKWVNQADLIRDRWLVAGPAPMQLVCIREGEYTRRYE